MKKHRAALASFAAIAVTALCAPANASVIRVDFTGVFTSTTDKTGSVFGNGTGANSGVGTQISGFALWDLDKPGFLGPGSPSTTNNYEFDQQGCFCNPADDAIRTWVNIGGVEYAPDLNMGTRNSAFLSDAGSGDRWSESLRSSGHSQLSPVTNGAYDYLAVDRTFEFGWFDALGMTLSNANFDQPIDWLAGIDGTGGGSFSFKNQKWLGGNDQAFSGSAGDLLTDASGRFSLSTMHVSEVPEPDTLALLFAGALVVVGMGRRRVRNVARA